MTRPAVRVNTFFQSNNDNRGASIDLISKFFIFAELPLGIVRLTLLNNVKTIYVVVSSVYSSIFLCILANAIYGVSNTRILNTIVLSLCEFQLLFYVIFNFGLRNRLKLYYRELNLFDKEVGYKPKIGRGTIKNTIQIALNILYILIVFIVSIFLNLYGIGWYILPGVLSHCLELYFYGHLLSLLIPRLQLINHYMKLSLNEVEGLACIGNKVLCEMEKIMGLYQIVVKAYSYMMEAIKWQLLVTLIALFVNMLSASYTISLSVIRGRGNMMSLLAFVSQVLGVVFPLFAPCTYGDQVKGEVRKFRELLACRLYENQLDKKSRGIARALLAWTETRDMSFCLLRMLHIDISLPFKFVSLLVTYLIILLQFEKVINP